MNRHLIAFDTETATARGAQHLLEIAAVRVVDGEAVDTFAELVRPEVPIDDEVRAIHGISDDDVRSKDGARDVLQRFVEWVATGEDDVWICAHNVSFDALVLGFEALRHGVPLPDAPLIDTLKLARRFLPEAPDHKLETLTAHFEIEVDVHHRALPDAVACWKVLEACVERMRTSAIVDIWSEVLARGAARTTLAGARPTAPRFTPRLRPLEAALRERRSVRLHYGVDGAVSRLAIVPRLAWATREREYLEAECLRSGLLKTYRLDRVQRVEI